MSSEVISALIGACGALVGILFLYLLSAKDRERRNKAIEKGKDKYDDLNVKYEDLLKDKAEQSKRKITFQLEAIDHETSKIRKSGRPPDLWILGINAIGPLHQGREIIISLLEKGGKLRLLLLDPTGPVFKKRSDKEGDHVGRIGAELYASFYILMDIMKSIDETLLTNVEVKLHNKPPDRSLLMVNCDEQDGIIFDNPYPDLKKVRGMAGEMFSLVGYGKTKRVYLEDVAYYKELWKGADSIKVSIPDMSPRMHEWPFRKEKNKPVTDKG
jgi:hypothetical protein